MWRADSLTKNRPHTRVGRIPDTGRDKNGKHMNKEKTPVLFKIIRRNALTHTFTTYIHVSINANTCALKHIQVHTYV